MIDRFEKFSLAIAEIYKCWHQIAANELAKFGLKGPHVVYLVAFHNHKEGLTMVQLCELLNKDKSDVSRMVAILEKEQVVKKLGNYRANYVLTEKGLEIASIVVRKAENAVSLAGSSLSDREREIFYKSLFSIADNLKKLSMKGIIKDESVL